MGGSLTVFTMIAIAVIALLVLIILISFARFYIKVPQGWALIINDMSSTPKVKFTGGIVWPVINKKELMKISLITLEVDRKNKDGLICKDNIRADIVVAFYMRVNETQQDVLKVAKSIGVERASDRDAVHELFNAKFSEALKTVGKNMDFVTLFENRIAFRDSIIEVIGNDLNGYVLEDVAIDYLEQTPMTHLDPHNILDAEGIRKITELTAIQNVSTNELSKNEELAITKKNVETKEAMLELERQEADATARQKREVETIQAREEAETIKVQEEQRLLSERSRIKTEEELQVMEQNKMREVEVSENNRLRAVAIEEEKVGRARELEIVSKEREVELQVIEKEKALEVERKEIANVIRERVIVDKSVAEQEEKIKEVRVVAEADRLKQATVIAAEAQAEEELVKQVKQAQADEVQAGHKAKEINILAQANLEAAAKEADSKKQLAEGTQAEKAAPGLAEAQVKEVMAEAMQKEGLAEVKVMEEKMDVEATGSEKIGLAAAMVLKEKFKAEAEGLVEKFKAMNDMSPDSRQHEEFRMQLEKDFEQAIAEIDANKEISDDQAKVLATALESANIDIVGGGDYLQSFTKGLGLGKTVEGVLEKSPALESVLGTLLASKAASK
ncbi:hypothetical protein [uncultured Cocleimonas sp.]|uniref:hypothetical protein n=1 Tax=uncultured Cocleimonas sp. TaxID=1051587 RepID=UPI002628990C|nr:hypothetical protein [uncultured Cocleimonas sp.]